MPAPPPKTGLVDNYPNPNTGTFKASLGAFYEYVTTLLGATGSASAALTALGALSKSGDTINGDLTFQAGKKLIGDGATADTNKVSVDFGDPTANRAISFPDRSGTLIVSDGTEVGDVIFSVRKTGRTGFLRIDGKSIGDALSGATSLADPLAVYLFTAIWNGTTNIEVQLQDSTGVATGRGASAAADFAAHKRMVLLPAGYFFRALNESATGVDPNRANMSQQQDDNKAHTHPGVNAVTAFGPSGPGAYYTDSSGLTGSSGGAEARPKNIAIPAWIRYLPYQL